jgi:large subunit ribosomal protein L1
MGGHPSPLTPTNKKFMSTTVTKLRKRSKKYSTNYNLIQKKLAGRDKMSISEASELLFELEKPNFPDGPTVELHCKLNINPTKSDQLVRSTVTLPHGTGQQVRVAAFVNPEKEEEATQAGADIIGNEELINHIRETEKIDFDKAVADPSMMKSLAKIARILGVAGVMPNPKTGTVGDNISQMVQELKAGKLSFKNDKSGNVHLICGRVNSNFTPEQISENLKAALEAVDKAKPEVIKKKFILSTRVATTLSPSIPIDMQSE